MNNNVKGFIAVGVTLSVIGLAYYFLVYGKTFKKIDSNFDSVKNKLGIEPNKDNVIIVPFNNKKNIAQFYNNNRVIIFNSDKKIIVKGSYSNGGQTINLDNGNNIYGESVWNNLLQTLK